MKIKHFILGLVVTSAISAVFLCPDYSAAVPPKINPTPSDYNAGMSWEKAQKIDKPIVVNFYVDWCHFCQGFAPVLDKLRQQYGSKYSFVFINCDDPKNASLVKKFNIEAYPSLFLVDKKRNKKIYIDNSKYQNINLLKQDFNKFLK